jgi:hypothetical protein
MTSEQEYEFEIYHNGVHFKATVRGNERYASEKAFLDGLVGRSNAQQQAERPIPDPPSDLYILNDSQLEAYSAFRRQNKDQ